METKVWLTRGTNLFRPTKGDSVWLPAGTCLFVGSNQSLTHKHLIWVHGDGAYDCIPLSWLTLDPSTILETQS